MLWNFFMVTFSQITKLPYVECDPETFDDQVYMFTEEEAAKEFAKSYVEKNTPLLTVKVLRKQMPNFYMGLYAEPSFWVPRFRKRNFWES